MKILPITKPTENDILELEKLKEKETTEELTGEEAARLVFLSVKQFWNCEC